MKIQIYGAGMSGTFLAYRLKNEDIPFEIYDKMKRIDCSKISCAWGLVTKDLITIDEFKYKDYILTRVNNVIINGVKCQISNVVIFDKIKYLNDMWSILDVKPVERPDNKGIVVDATGEERALLPKSKNDKLYPTMQSKVKCTTLDNKSIYVYFDKSLAYAWAFPIIDDYWHIGAGGYDKHHANKLYNKLIKYYDINVDKTCTCKSKIRVCNPKDLKIYHNNIVGVGESIGLVSIFGEGNSPAIVSANLIADIIFNIYNGIYTINEGYYKYEQLIYDKFNWIIKQHEFLDRWNKGRISAVKYINDVIQCGINRTGCKLTKSDIFNIILNVLA